MEYKLEKERIIELNHGDVRVSDGDDFNDPRKDHKWAKLKQKTIDDIRKLIEENNITIEDPDFAYITLEITVYRNEDGSIYGQQGLIDCMSLKGASYDTNMRLDLEDETLEEIEEEIIGNLTEVELKSNDIPF